MGTVQLQPVPGGVTAPAGFRAAGVAAGLKKKGGLDLALIVSEFEASAAATFTTNAAAAPPVRVNRERIRTGRGRAVVVNSGCANSFTGKRGFEDAVAMASEAARTLGVSEELVYVCSTGHIGSFLPMDLIKAGITEAKKSLSNSSEEAAAAIMTTDTKPKICAFAHPSGFTIGGMAKGAGMISPNMATMLAFITTDAVVEGTLLQSTLDKAVAESFNRIIVDGDQSTNDTVLLLANGASGVEPHPEEIADAVGAVCRALAEAIVEDGEGATKLANIVVNGAANVSEAEFAARQVANSSLVKTALYGGDANWGRIAAALGQSKVTADFDQISISVAGHELLSSGTAAPGEVVEQAREAMATAERIEIVCDLHAGQASWEVFTTDLSPEYVELNAEYEV